MELGTVSVGTNYKSLGLRHLGNCHLAKSRTDTARISF